MFVATSFQGDYTCEAPTLSEAGTSARALAYALGSNVVGLVGARLGAASARLLLTWSGELMNIVGTGKRVRIYIGEHDKAAGHHEPLWETILELLRKEGAAGATMVRGMAGFGAHSKLHVARLADIVPDLPVLVEWIDGPERVERLLPRVCELVRSGTITLEDVDIVKYTHRAPRPLPPDRVEEVMTPKVVTVHPETPLGEVVRLLIDRDLRSLPVVEADQQLG